MESHYRRDLQLLAEQIINTVDTTRPEPEYLRAPADLARYVKRWNIPLAQAPDAHDLAEVLVLRRRLRAVYEARDMTVAAGILNELLDGIWVRPQLGLQPNGSITLNLAVGADLPLARRLGAEAALGLAAALKQYGLERFHVCKAAPCTEVFVDTSRNHTRRYCCAQCANRHNVSAFRKRQRAEGPRVRRQD
jgi:predicted RNA-binding Zn ribbon-like protein